MTFNLHDSQAEIVQEAIKLASIDLTEDELYEFTKWLREQGVTAKQINVATGTQMGSHYITDKTQPNVPTEEMWQKMKHLVNDVPDRINELIYRKTLSQTDNENRNGNALTDICKEYLQGYERKRD